MNRVEYQSFEDKKFGCTYQIKRANLKQHRTKKSATVPRLRERRSATRLHLRLWPEHRQVWISTLNAQVLAIERDVQKEKLKN